MTILYLLLPTSITTISAAFPLVIAVYFLYPYFITYRHLRDIPAVFPAQFTNLWLFAVCRRGERYRVVDEAHKRLGPIVRLGPNHVSIADVDAIGVIYGHGNGLLKSDFYDAFVSIHRGLFNTRNRAEHTRKRKLISHTFAPKSVGEFEPYVQQHLRLFVKKWDELCQKAGSGLRDSEGYTQIDCLSWFNYLAFDTIADLAFGKPFGMLAAGADIAEIKKTPTSPPTYEPACEILNRRGEVSATLGIMPWLKPYAMWLPDPFFSKGSKAVQSLAGIAIARVSDRLSSPPTIDRKDLLARLMEGKDEHGQPLGREELTAEALTQLIAGSDTTSNSSCALLYHIARTPHVMPKLRAELDQAVSSDMDIPTYAEIQHLPYLDSVINETLRVHSTSGIGLPREIPVGSTGIHLHGHSFPAGSVLSVPTYSIHHSKQIWGDDADEFRPERWEPDNLTAEQKSGFLPFGYGPRSCVGRNLAEMQMKLIAAAWARRFDVVLRQGEMQTREGFLRKPLGLEVGIKRRDGL